MKKYLALIIIIITILIFSDYSFAEPASTFIEQFSKINDEGLNFNLQLLLFLTLLTFIPGIIITMTSFTRIIIVLSFIRNAIGTQQTPPNQVLIGLSLFLTLFVMSPVLDDINNVAIQPYLNGEITESIAIEEGTKPLRSFMFKQTRDKDLALFMDIAKIDKVNGLNEIPMKVLIPSFIISELKTAFQIGFIIFVPFLVIDMVVASTLMSMGMMMLPPVMISLPFKILLFVMVDGWNLIIKSLVTGFN